MFDFKTTLREAEEVVKKKTLVLRLLVIGKLGSYVINNLKI